MASRSTIVYLESGVVKRWMPPTSSAAVGYSFLVPDTSPRALYGVNTHIGVEQ